MGTGHDNGALFVVGAMRSGTTLMRLILNAHPRIGIPDETKLLFKVYEPYRRGEAWPRTVDRAMELLSQSLKPAIDLSPVREQLLALPAPDFAALMDLSFSAWARAEGKERWGEKTPLHVFYSEPIVAMFPQARFVEMIRDPRAVIASMTRSKFTGDDPTRNAIYWRVVMDEAHAALHRNAADGHVHTVRYEALVAEPEQTIRGVCEFLGEEFDPGMLAFGERSRTYLSGARTADDPKLSQGVRADLDSWRRTLADDRLAITEEICGPTMERFGYERCGRPVTRAERREIAAQSAYVAYKRRRHRGDYFHSFTGPIAGGLRSRARAARPAHIH